MFTFLRGAPCPSFAHRGERGEDTGEGSCALKLKTVQMICLIVLTLVLLSVPPLSREKPAAETAYTQDGHNCVRGHVRDQDNRPIPAARVSLLIEKTLAPVGFLETDQKGDFTFRTVPFNEELMLAVEADGFTRATVPGITVRPSYSLVATVRLSREAAKP